MTNYPTSQVAATSYPVAAPWVAPATAQPARTGIQHTAPWVAGAIYGVVPSAHLAMVPDNGEKWYAITKGRYVGVTNSTAVADNAVTRVSHALRSVYTTQAEAVQAFNDALDMNIGLIEVIR
ncbi:hypothetical protein DFH06DRAFT_1129072 [Mycena polygramma]|nr:hypothetical protein DFH06DRAFT_1339905 [Mycena polygramma]KAJ7661890.1 hypothetical protein DFH06DRAFT_1129072 [Mycena polygramma]